MSRRRRGAVVQPPCPRAVARQRALVVACAIGGVFALSAVRAFDLQVRRGPELEEMARRQHERTISLRPRRGAIVDRDDRPLAVSLDAESIYADPTRIDPDELPLLAAALGRDVTALRETLSSGGRRFAWLERGALPDVVERVRVLAPRGVGFLPESRRFYPDRELAAPLLGFVGIDGHGLEGLERTQDEALTGTGLELVATRDALGRPLHTAGFEPDLLDRSGATLALTLDASVQEIVEEELERARVAHGAKAGVAVVLEPATGDVLAMASVPGFNANAFADAAVEHRRNRAVTDVFEPGSTMKAVLLAAAIEHGSTEESRVYDVHDGEWRRPGHVIHDVKAFDELSLADVLRVSSNIGAAQVALDLGAYRYGRALEGFGFGQRTGLGLGGESPGIVRDPRGWNSVDLATIGFGQGVGCTALQLAQAFATLANDGVRMRPRLVREIRSSRGVVISAEAPHEAARPISAETARRITALLEDAAGPDGTGHAAVPDGIRVAGKTGTTQKARLDGPGYASDRWIASFAGFAPADAPRMAVVVVLDEPQGSGYGGVVAAPAFRAIVERALPVLELAPHDAPEDTGHGSDLELLLATRTDAEAAAARARRDAPRTAAEVLASLHVPDLGGLTMRAAHREAAAAALELDAEGRGLCIRQDPPPGAARDGVERVHAWFAPPADAVDAIERTG